MKNKQTILDTMVADIYVNHDDGSVTVLHADAFDEPLEGLEYDVRKGRLWFKFQTYEADFGVDLFDEFAEFLKKSKSITLLHIDLKTKKTLGGMEVPLILRRTI